MGNFVGSQRKAEPEDLAATFGTEIPPKTETAPPAAVPEIRSQPVAAVPKLETAGLRPQASQATALK